MRTIQVGLSITAAFAALPVNAETTFAKAGTFMVSGGLEFSDSDSTTEVIEPNRDNEKTETSETTFSVVPKVGYFLVDGLAVVAGVAVSSRDVIVKEGKDRTETSNSSTGAVLELGMFHPVAESVFVFGRAGLARVTGTTEVKTDTQKLEGDLTAMAYSGSAGLLLTLGHGSGGFVSFSATATKTSGEAEFEAGDVDVDETEFGFGAGFGLFF